MFSIGLRTYWSLGKSLMADPERAPLVKRAFEEYATGRYTKEQLLKRARAWGLTDRRGRPLTSQAIGVLVRNQLYAGIVDVPEYVFEADAPTAIAVHRRTGQRRPTATGTSSRMGTVSGPRLLPPIWPRWAPRTRDEWQ